MNWSISNSEINQLLKSFHIVLITVVGAKAPRKQLAAAPNLGSPGSKDKHGGGNPVRWTPTPSWQKGKKWGPWRTLKNW